MSWMKRIKQLFGQSKPTAAGPRLTPPAVIENEEEPVVPELTPVQVQAALVSEAPPLLVDVRELYEWQQVRIPQARHLPMNDVPANLTTLPQDQPLVIFCAHGSRSYSVAAWLLAQGYTASNLQGGITQWAAQGGAVEQGMAR